MKALPSPAYDFVGPLLVVALAALLALFTSYFNHHTTIAVGSMPAALAVLIPAIPVLIGVLVYWFKVRSDLPRVPAWN